MNISDVWSWLTISPKQPVQPVENPSMELDFPASFEREYPEAFPICWKSVDAVREAIQHADLSPLERRSPGLKANDWSAYLRCSTVRMVKALMAVQGRLQPRARVLDMGSYFGNFSLMLASAGFSVDAVDSYGAYEHAFDPIVRLMSDSGINVMEIDDNLKAEYYDAVFLMGVIEHIPHTPRRVLESINRSLRPGGYLVMDTPNLAYIYNRQKLARGESPFCPIAAQYYTDLPFEGHHREYTVAEIRWMLEQIGHDQIVLDTFSYSLYALETLVGNDLQNYLAMQQDPSGRELIFSMSQKRNTA